jgi:hypothetical protein
MFRGKGVEADKLDAKEQIRLRKQAFDWLQADLVERARFLEKTPLFTYLMNNDMQHWQQDADLAGLRDEKELAKLPKDERAALTKFWGEVDRLTKQARANYTQTEHKGQLDAKERAQSYPIKMTAGKTYTIDMESPEFDTYLRLQDELIHGGGRRRQELHPDLVAAPEADEELLAVDAALTKVAEHDPLKARLVELRYFAGLSGDQAAEILGISASTADRHWIYARAWLRREVQGDDDAEKKVTKSWCCKARFVA